MQKEFIGNLANVMVLDYTGAKDMAKIENPGITKEQLDILEHNCYLLENEELADYHGAGFGIVSFDKDGKLVELKYIDYDDVLENNELEHLFYSDQIMFFDINQYLSLDQIFNEKRRSHEQNMNCLPFNNYMLSANFKSGGCMELLVNFSSTELHRF
ncbi:hypothetical protein [Aquamicrobium sp.]|uniref:hypothetical protein n=1 Tax=Aquamicrobium sp. TaxID=1872579 RepID=UPI002589A373|nr:hypothetical protein [Aquamicrobium sp.]MCK9553113.1 hypothetical protein [Aquamicrobium sp.]